MLSKGANHDLADTNGCTVAHVLVVFDLMRMWDMAVECGAAINIENVFGLTPLTLAAYLARMDMFFHIASVEREIYWQLGKFIQPNALQEGKVPSLASFKKCNQGFLL